MSEREDARMRLQESVDQLGQQASLQVQMQKEPLKMLGIATGVGAVIGIVLGRSLSKTKKIYVDETLSKKDQKAFAKAQARHKGPAGNIGGALLATLGTLAFKIVQDRFIAPKLEELAQNLNQQAGGSAGKSPRTPKPSKDVIIRDFRAPTEKAHADERGNLIHARPASRRGSRLRCPRRAGARFPGAGRKGPRRSVRQRHFGSPTRRRHHHPLGQKITRSARGITPLSRKGERTVWAAAQTVLLCLLVYLRLLQQRFCQAGRVGQHREKQIPSGPDEISPKPEDLTATAPAIQKRRSPPEDQNDVRPARRWRRRRQRASRPLCRGGC